MIIVFLKGLLIGFSIAAPVGPIGLLCIQRSLSSGFKMGFLTGMGAAIADGFYGAIAAFGLTSVSFLLVSHQLLIRIMGGLFLIYFGTKLFFKRNDPIKINSKAEKSSFHAFITTFFLTLTNPMTILSFVAIFAGLGIGTLHADYTNSSLMILGVIIGSALWWFTLSAVVTYFLHKKINDFWMDMINRLSGVIIFVFGLIALCCF